MLKKLICVFTIIALIFSLSINIHQDKVFAETNENNSQLIVTNISNKEITSINDLKIINQKVDNIELNNDNSLILMFDKNTLDKELPENTNKLYKKAKMAFENQKYILLYGDALSSENALYDLVDVNSNRILSEAIDNKAKENENNLIAYGIIRNSNGTYHIESFYGENSNDLNQEIDFVFRNIKKTMKIKDDIINRASNKDKVKPQAFYQSPDYVVTKNYDHGGYGDYQSTMYVERAFNISGKTFWDVKYSNTSTAGWIKPEDTWWQVDEVITRSSVSAFGAEGLIDSGPTTTGSGKTASVNLSESGGSVGWSWPLEKVSVTQLYYGSSGYVRWIFDYTRWSDQAENSYKMEPGARFTNTSGNMALDTSHSIKYWNAWNGDTNTVYTGVYRNYFTDWRY